METDRKELAGEIPFTTWPLEEVKPFDIGESEFPTFVYDGPDKKSASLKIRTSEEFRKELYEQAPLLKVFLDESGGKFVLAGGSVTSILTGNKLKRGQDVDLFPVDVDGDFAEFLKSKLKMMEREVLRLKYIRELRESIEHVKGSSADLQSVEHLVTECISEGRTTRFEVYKMILSKFESPTIQFHQTEATKQPRLIVKNIGTEKESHIFETRRPFDVLRCKGSITIKSSGYYFDHPDIQIVLKRFPRGSVLKSFDLGSCGAQFDGSNVRVSRLGKFSLETRCIIANVARASIQFTYRISKYMRRGFNLIVPFMNTSAIPRDNLDMGDPQWIFLSNISMRVKEGEGNIYFVNNIKAAWLDSQAPIMDYKSEFVGAYETAAMNISHLLKGSDQRLHQFHSVENVSDYICKPPNIDPILIEYVLARTTVPIKRGVLNLKHLRNLEIAEQFKKFLDKDAPKKITDKDLKPIIDPLREKIIRLYQEKISSVDWRVIELESDPETLYKQRQGFVMVEFEKDRPAPLTWNKFLGKYCSTVALVEAGVPRDLY